MLESGEVLEFGRSKRNIDLSILVPDSVASAPVIGPTVVEQYDDDEDEEADNNLKVPEHQSKQASAKPSPAKSS